MKKLLFLNKKDCQNCQKCNYDSYSNDSAIKPKYCKLNNYE